MGAAIGSGALALNQKYNLTGKIGITNPEKMSKLIRLTNGNIKVTASGEIETGYTQIKNVPKQLRDLYALELDKLTGKVKVVGFITKSGGKNVVQPIIREYDATFLDDLMRAKQVGPRAVKTVLVKRLGEDGFKQLQSVTLKDGGKQLIEMSPLEIQKAMYKELGYGSQYVRAIQNFSKEKPLLLHKDTHIEYLGSVGDVKDIGKLRMPDEVQRLYKDLKALGFDTVESRYWASQILTKSPEKIVGKMENIIDNDYSQQKLMELSAKYNGSGKGSSLVSGLKAEGFTDAQLEKVVKLVAQSIDDPRGFAAGVNNLKASDSQLVALFKGVPTESLGISLTYMDVKPLVSLVGAADSALRANLVSVMSGSMLAGVVGKLSVEGVNSVTPHISQNNLVYLFSNPDVKTDVKADLVKSMTPE